MLKNMTIGLFFAVLGLVPVAKSEDFAHCAWRKAPLLEHQVFMEAYLKDPDNSDDSLQQFKYQLMNDYAACANRYVISANLGMRAIFAQATQEAASAQVKARLGISRDRLDQVWAQTEGPAECLMDGLANSYGMSATLNCWDRNAIKGLLAPFHFSSKIKASDKKQVLIYFIGKGNEGMAEVAFALRYRATPVSATPTPKP